MPLVTDRAQMDTCVLRIQNTQVLMWDPSMQDALAHDAESQAPHGLPAIISHDSSR
jgi:hypothetical protein